MNPIFTLQYGEFFTADYLKNRSKNYSVFIPTSSNEKGVDLLLYNDNTKSLITIQVKSARPFFGEREYDEDNSKNKIVSSCHYRFPVYYNRTQADWHVFVCYAFNERFIASKKKKDRWDSVMFLFSKKEIDDCFCELKDSKGNREKYFEISIDDNENAYITRGYGKKTAKPINSHLIDKKYKEIFEKSARKIEKERITE